MKEDTLILLAIIGIFISSFVLGWLGNNIYDDKMNEKNNNFYLNKGNSFEIDVCFNLSMENTGECLREELRATYKYNLNNTQLYWNHGKPNTQNINWSIIEQDGGVCWHFAEWYVMRARQLGFEGKRVSVPFSDEDAGHAIALITDKHNTYCILDQLFTVHCRNMG